MPARRGGLTSIEAVPEHMAVAARRSHFWRAPGHPTTPLSSLLGRFLRLVGLDLGDLDRDPPLGLHRVIGILQPQEVALR